MGVTAMGIMATPTDTTTVASDQLTPLLTLSLLLMLILLQTPMLSLMGFTVMVIAVATTLTVVTMVTAMGIMATPTDTATVDNINYPSTVPESPSNHYGFLYQHYNYGHCGHSQ